MTDFQLRRSERDDRRGDPRPRGARLARPAPHAPRAGRAQPPLRERAARARAPRLAGARAARRPRESGQDHLAIYLYNGNEYVEAMLGAFKARVAPLNVNYRYVAEELTYLFEHSRAKAVDLPRRVRAAPRRDPRGAARARRADPGGRRLGQRAAARRRRLRGRARAASPAPPAVSRSPDDLYILYTGGTTGMPKGVLWRSADIYASAMGGRRAGRPRAGVARGDRRVRARTAPRGCAR